MSNTTQITEREWIICLGSTLSLVGFFWWISTFRLEFPDRHNKLAPDQEFVHNVLLKNKPTTNDPDPDSVAVPKISPPSPTPLLDAIKRENLETAQQALSAGADINQTDAEGNTPLFWAVKNNNVEAVKLLLRQPGIDPRCQNNAGLSAYAQAFNNEEIRTLLEEHGAIR